MLNVYIRCDECKNEKEYDDFICKKCYSMPEINELEKALSEVIDDDTLFNWNEKKGKITDLYESTLDLDDIKENQLEIFMKGYRRGIVSALISLEISLQEYIRFDICEEIGKKLKKLKIKGIFNQRRM